MPEGMLYREYQPGGRLARYIRCYWTLEGRAAPISEPVFPDGSMEMVFHHGDPFERLDTAGNVERQPRALLAGQILGPLWLRPTGSAGVFGVRFRPGGAYPFLKFPQQEVTGRIIGLDLVWNGLARELTERVAEAPGDAARIPVIERALAARLDPGLSLPPSGLLSDRQYRRRFAEAAGLSPKLFERIRRFQRSLARIGSMPLAAIAADCGYADQAHLSRDFREFSGLTPGQYLRGRLGDTSMTEFFKTADAGSDSLGS